MLILFKSSSRLFVGPLKAFASICNHRETVRPPSGKHNMLYSIKSHIKNRTINKFKQISCRCRQVGKLRTDFQKNPNKKTGRNIYTDDKSVSFAFHSSVCRSGIGSTGTASWQPECGRKRQTKDVSEGEWWRLGRHAVSKWWKSNQGCQDGFLWETGTVHRCCRLL